MSGSDASFLDEDNSLKIQFHSGNTAEALDKRKFGFDHRQEDAWTANEDLWWQMDGIDEFEDTKRNDCNGEPKSDEEIAQNIAQREEVLRLEFESQVNKRVEDINDVIPWNLLQTVLIF